MISIHRVRRIEARHGFREGNWIELTFHGSAIDPTDKSVLTLYVEYEPPEGHLNMTVHKFAEALADAINHLPMASDFEQPEAEVIDFPTAQA